MVTIAHEKDQYDPANVYNADETGLYFRATAGRHIDIQVRRQQRIQKVQREGHCLSPVTWPGVTSSLYYLLLIKS